MMQIQTLILGELSTNCYLVVDSISQECIVIDPAEDAQLISDEILRQNLTLKEIVATHGHYDHNLASSQLQLNFDVPFLIHQEDEFLIKDLANRAEYWLKRKVELQSPLVSDYLREGSQIQFGNSRLNVIYTPGHTPGGCCFFNKEEGLIFTGDTLFADDVEGRTDLSYSSPKQMKRSLARIKEEFSGYRGLPGHGREFIV
ncbi:MAG: beta-lactamase domain protein [Microgenomates bacterium 39_7]|nr:MAG: beta-lactamase domain protein [Microgenomates bacterium 39_7]